MIHDENAFKKLSPATKEWLSYTESLTERLIKFLPEITFHVISDVENTFADSSAQKALNIAPETKARVRNIEWRLKEETLIKATVAIPHTSITPETNVLSNIGNIPIGKVLFTDPDLKRSDFLFYFDENKWVRESIFIFKTKPLLVRETFLPAFFVIIQRNKIGYAKTSNFDVILNKQLRKKARRTRLYVEPFDETFYLKARKSGRFFKEAE